MDTDHVQNGAAPICTPSARPPTLASLAQAGAKLGTQHTARHGVKRSVDGLVADLERRVVRLHSAQYARDLLRRMSIVQQSCDVAPQWASLGQTRWAACRSRQPQRRCVAQIVHAVLRVILFVQSRFTCLQTDQTLVAESAQIPRPHRATKKHAYLSHCRPLHGAPNYPYPPTALSCRSPSCTQHPNLPSHKWLL